MIVERDAQGWHVVVPGYDVHFLTDAGKDWFLEYCRENGLIPKTQKVAA